LLSGESERRVVLLTGAGSPLGDAFCAAYADEYDIVAVCRNRIPSTPSQFEDFVDPLDPAASLPDNEKRVFIVRADLEKEGEPERVVELALAKFGGVDVLVNNAAYWTQTGREMIDGESALADFGRHFEVNVGLPMRLATRLAQQSWRNQAALNRARHRNVINISSTSGSRVYQSQGHAVYAASKAALDHLTRYMAMEFEAFGVRANALAPAGFPHEVSTESVAAGIRRLDQTKNNGRVLVLDAAPGVPRSAVAKLVT
jgi:NAD(P)-dependent dehydrogenase (short-subunit alcohol dehydrogenase family)